MQSTQNEYMKEKEKKHCPQYSDSSGLNYPSDRIKYNLIAFQSKIPVLANVDWHLLSSQRVHLITFWVKEQFGLFSPALFPRTCVYVCICVFRLPWKLLLNAVVPSRRKPNQTQRAYGFNVVSERGRERRNAQMKSRDPLLLFFSGVCMTLTDPLPLTYVFRHREEGRKGIYARSERPCRCQLLTHGVVKTMCTKRDSEEIWFRP